MQRHRKVVEAVLRVFLVEDHEVVRRDVAEMIEGDDDMTVVGQAATVAQALARIPALQPDLALLDVRLPDGNGVELCRELTFRMPQLNCLVLTSFTDEQAVLDAILAGRAGMPSRTSAGWSCCRRSAR